MAGSPEVASIFRPGLLTASHLSGGEAQSYYYRASISSKTLVGEPQEAGQQVGLGSELLRGKQRSFFSLQVIIKSVLSGPPMGSLTPYLQKETG